MYQILYYAQTNIICIIIMSLVLNSLKKFGSNETKFIIFKKIIIVTIICCLSDMITGILRGQNFIGAKSLIIISNIFYLESIGFIGYYWMSYVQITLNKKNNKKITNIFLLIIISILVFTNLFNNKLFIINENNLYEPGPYSIIYQFITWLYILIPTLTAFSKFLKVKNKIKKEEIKLLCLFIIAPAIASIIQILYYGITFFQVGITVSVLMIFLDLQNKQIAVDELTGLNNRRAFNNYINNKWEIIDEESYICLVMIDVNDFKKINDKYGHIVGDQALKEVANLLKISSNKFKKNIFLARYGGDEFVMLYLENNKENIQKLINTIKEQEKIFNEKNTKKYKLFLSVGYQEKKKKDYKSINDFISQADLSMYENKKSFKPF